MQHLIFAVNGCYFLKSHKLGPGRLVDKNPAGNIICFESDGQKMFFGSATILAKQPLAKALAGLFLGSFGGRF
jgi:hypothetical protein